MPKNKKSSSKNKSSHSFRIEHDALGKVKVPKNAYYGCQTARGIKLYQIANQPVKRELLAAIIRVKIAAAHANAQCNTIPKKIANAIMKAGNEILTHKIEIPDQFPIDVFQAGAGTVTHMNVNEVLTNRALEIIKKKKGQYQFINSHDHTNFGQSTNDVIPTATRVATVTATAPLVSELKSLISELKRKAKSFHNIPKSGRTHLMDAVPLTLGQEFQTYAQALENRLHFLLQAKKQCLPLSIGGSAVGNGLNTHPLYAKRTVAHLKRITKIPFISHKNKMVGTQFMTDLLDLSSALRNLATDLNKIANDLRLLASGPLTGLSELLLPAVHPGSSIMPGKVNPSIPEMINMVCFQVMGNDHTVQQAANAGQLNLNVFAPIIAHNLLESLMILKNAINTLTKHCIKGIKPNKKTLQKYFETSPIVGTVLNPVIGYDKAAEIIKQAIKEEKTVKQVMLEKNILPKKQVEKLFSPKNVLNL